MVFKTPESYLKWFSQDLAYKSRFRFSMSCRDISFGDTTLDRSSIYVGAGWNGFLIHIKNVFTGFVQKIDEKKRGKYSCLDVSTWDTIYI